MINGFNVKVRDNSSNAFVSPTLNRSCFTKRGGVNHQYKIFWFQRYRSIALRRITSQN